MTQNEEQNKMQIDISESEEQLKLAMDQVQDVSIIVKWSGKEFLMNDLTSGDTVEVLRHEIYKKTQVRPNRQKLLNLKYKGKPAPDNLKLGDLEMKANFKLMMVGSTEADIEDACQKPDDIGEIIDDFEDGDDKMVSLEKSPIYLAKIRKRILTYKIEEFNPPREGKRLLVLDIDYTLFDHRSSAEQGSELMRPYLHEFLGSAYIHYDIVIWSATSMRWIEEKMRLLGVSSNPDYKILFYLDSNAMISVYTSNRGVLDVKPLGVIWGNYSQYSTKNTIMFDDIRRNFLMNPKNGLRIRPFRMAHLNRTTDKELLKLSKYLSDIATHCDDFTKLNHRKWENYDPRNH